jgi:hypothetical protein
VIQYENQLERFDVFVQLDAWIKDKDKETFIASHIDNTKKIYNRNKK